MEYKTTHAARIPALGFGTFQLKPPDARRTVEMALDCGYRHIDTAQLYRNEAAVGAAITASGVNRSEIFLTTKIWFTRYHAGDLETSVDESLERLTTDYVDLLLLHWPNPDIPLEETMGALMRVREQGKARSVGISNHPTAQVSRVVGIVGPEAIVTNQVEYHPFLNQGKVLQQARELGMSVTAYAPLAQGTVIGDTTLRSIGQRYDKSEAQVALRWLLQQDGVIAIPRTRSEAHARANFEVFDFELDDGDMRRIDGLRGNRRLISPEFAPEWDQP